jgi:hypothetical protein
MHDFVLQGVDGESKREPSSSYAQTDKDGFILGNIGIQDHDKLEKG